MSNEQNPNQHHREVVDKFHNPTASYQMKTYDYVMRPQPGAQGDGAITITLPPVAEAKGRWYSIIARGISGGTVTVADKDDSEAWGGDVTMNSTGDRMLCYSDGISWLAFFANNNAPS
jgi:hypothetical protein